MSEKKQPNYGSWPYPMYNYTQYAYAQQGCYTPEMYQNYANYMMYQNMLFQQQRAQPPLPPLPPDDKKNNGNKSANETYGKLQADMPPLPPGSPPGPPPPPPPQAPPPPPPPPPPPLISMTMQKPPLAHQVPSSSNVEIVSDQKSDTTVPIKFSINTKQPSVPVNNALVLDTSKKRRRKRRRGNGGSVQNQGSVLANTNALPRVQNLSLSPTPQRPPLLPTPPTSPMSVTSHSSSPAPSSSLLPAPLSLTSKSNNVSRIKNSNLIDDWPPSVTDYVTRCFDKYSDPRDKDEITNKVYQKILNSGSDGSLWVKDWENEPLPMLEREIKQMTTTPTYKPRNAPRFSTPSQELYTPRRQYTAETNSSRFPAPTQGFGVIATQNQVNRTAEYDKKGGGKQQQHWNRKRENGKPIDSYDGQSSHKVGKISDMNPDIKEQTGSNPPNKPVNNKIVFKKPPKRDDKKTINPELLEDKERIERRMERFSLSKKPGKVSAEVPVYSVDKLLKDSRLNIASSSSFSLSFIDHKIIGTCQDIEKDYFRLNSDPDPCTIRPLEVLKMALLHVKQHWIENQDYDYTCNQLKSIRQDLTVQGIRGEFAMEVYETHARIALENGDFREFNQCQSQLIMLYDKMDKIVVKNRLEFLCYHVLYCILMKNPMDLAADFKQLMMEDREDVFVKFALDICCTWQTDNYYKMFLMYKQAPGMCSYIMDLFVERERKNAFVYMVKSYFNFWLWIGVVLNLCALYYACNFSRNQFSSVKSMIQVK